ncbi:MAG: type II toxin-antitoxin system VapC family toxin [Chitinophagaceae bacterium]|nr:type II toxin-antitoxin system VapC family toxin [Polaromonas sp.]
MIILDPHVVSEPLKPKPDAAVLKWLDAQDPQTLYMTTLNLAELLAGIELMPAGRKRTDLKSALDHQIMPLFDGRILPFDAKAAVMFALINSKVQSQGANFSFAVGAIAAIAQVHKGAVATRNLHDFKSTGVVLLNPWDA